MLRTIILWLSFGAAMIWAQCGNMAVNPDTGLRDCIGTSGFTITSNTNGTLPVAGGGNSFGDSNLTQNLTTGNIIPLSIIGSFFAVVPFNAGAPDFSSCNLCSLTLTGDATATDSTIPPAGMYTYIIVTNSHALTWPANFVGFPSIVAGAGSITVWQHAISDGTNVSADGPAYSNKPATEVDFTCKAAPGTPTTGVGAVYCDSTSKNLAIKDDAGVVKHGVQTDAGTANNYISAISDAGAITKSRPACATLSDSALGCNATRAINPQTATYQVVAADFSNAKIITVASGTFTITLVASGSQPAAGQYIDILNYGTGVVTVAASGQNINGVGTSQTLAAGSASAPTGLHVVSDGANYFAQTLGGAGSNPVAGNGITTSGSTVNFNPLDAAQVWWRDDFFPNGTTVALGSIVGQLAWRTTAIASGTGGNLAVGNFAYPHLGSFIVASDGTANHGIGLAPSTTTATKLTGDMSTNTNWDSYWIFQLSQTTVESIYLGFADDVTTISQNNSIMVRFDTAAGDTNFTFQTTQTAHTNITTSVTNSIAADTNWHCARIRSTVAGTIKFSIGSTCTTLGTETSINTNVPTAALSPMFQVVQTTTATAPHLNIDFWAFQETGVSR